MPVLVSLAKGPTLPNTGCDFANPDTNRTQEETMTGVASLIQAIRNYEEFITAEVPDPSNNMIFYSNFKTTEIAALVTENPDCHFIRIYHGRNEDESQFTIAVPVVGNSTGRVKQTPDVKYYVNCCACKPNCSKNNGF